MDASLRSAWPASVDNKEVGIIEYLDHSPLYLVGLPLRHDSVGQARRKRQPYRPALPDKRFITRLMRRVATVSYH
jgi:hypothetical protein